MKQSIKVLAVFFVLAAFAFVLPKHSLAGRWGIAGTKEFVNFKKDGAYEVYLEDGKVGERGFYELNDSVFRIKNAKPVCGDGYWGVYRINFYGPDSVHFAVIEDSCSQRRMDIVGYNPGLRRLKK